MPTTYSKTDLEYEILYNPSFVPIRRGMVSVKTVDDSAGRRYFMRNHASGAYYDLDETAYTIWTLLDGQRTAEQIVTEAEKRKIKPDDAYGVLLFFAESEALSSVSEEERQRRLRVVSAFRVEIALIRRSQQFLEKIHRVLRPLLRKPLLWIAYGLMALTSVLFTANFIGLISDQRNLQRNLEIAGPGSAVLGFFFFQFVILMPIIAIHEISHGLALVHYGGRPGEIGTGLLFFGLMFYVDATDSWSLKRGQRMMVMIAGILSTVVIGAVLVALLYLVPLGSLTHQLVLMTAFFCFYTALWNLAPPFETDGYYVLADALNMPNLKPEAYGHLSRALKRLLGMRTDATERIPNRKKMIYTGYLILSLAFIVFIIYTTLSFAYLMATNAGNHLLRLLLFENLGSREIAIALVSIFYFALSISGYGLVFATALKKSLVRTVRFETVHDRDLSVFTYLPERLPPHIQEHMEEQMRGVGSKFTPYLNITRTGPLRAAVLRMGGTRVGVQQLREHLRKPELAYSSMYQKFLMKHNDVIQFHAGIYSPHKSALTATLVRIGKELSSGPVKEPERIVRQLLLKQQRTTLYLLNASFSSVWTVEVPPALQQEFQEVLMPSLLAEDLSVTDLFGATEEFKKSVVYGYDSLHALSMEAKENLREALENPELHQVVCSFEPVKGRLLFLGRTERIEGDLPVFASLFLNQVWSGYMDNLLSETNLTLSAVGDTIQPSEDEIKSLHDGEITALRRNLAELGGSKEYVGDILTGSRRNLQSVRSNIKKLPARIRHLGTHGLEMLESMLAVNRENIDSLPDRFNDFEILAEKHYDAFSKVELVLEAEYLKRATAFRGRRRRVLTILPFFLALSAVLIILGLSGVAAGYGTLLILLGVLVDFLYGLLYLQNRRSFSRVGRYHSTAFDRLETHLFAVTQAIFNLISTADILKPGDIATRSSPNERTTSSKKSVRGKVGERGSRQTSPP